MRGAPAHTAGSASGLFHSVTECPPLGSSVSTGASGTQLGGLAAPSLPSASVAEALSPALFVPAAQEPRRGPAVRPVFRNPVTGSLGGSGGQTGPGHAVCLSSAWGIIWSLGRPAVNVLGSVSLNVLRKECSLPARLQTRHVRVSSRNTSLGNQLQTEQREAAPLPGACRPGRAPRVAAVSSRCPGTISPSARPDPSTGSQDPT